MVVVETGALFGRQLGLVAVVAVVLDEVDSRSWEAVEKCAGDCGFAGSGTSGDADDESGHGSES